MGAGWTYLEGETGESGHNVGDIVHRDGKFYRVVGSRTGDSWCRVILLPDNGKRNSWYQPGCIFHKTNGISLAVMRLQHGST